MVGLRKYRLIAQTGVMVTAVRVLTRLATLPRVLGWLHRAPLSPQPNRTRLDDAAYYTDRWLTLFPANPKGNCFPRSLTLYWFARRFGFPVRFHCGVQRNGQVLDGHAWLSLNGTAFLEPSRHWEGFAVTVSFPSSGPEDAKLAKAPHTEPRSVSNRS